MTNNMKLFLDDIRMPDEVRGYKNEDFQIVRTYHEFVNFIEKYGLPSFISFDHDLADEHYHGAMYESIEAYTKLYDTFKEKTGYDAAKWLVEHCMNNNLPLPQYFVHSMNPAGRENIMTYLRNFARHRD